MLISGIIGSIFAIEGILTFLIAQSLGWTWTDAQFNIGFLVFILIWFMQFNELIGNVMLMWIIRFLETEKKFIV